MEKIDPLKPDTTRINTESPFVIVAEKLDGSLKAACEELGVEFKTVEADGVRAVRQMVSELFKNRDISHYHHLNNVELLAGVILSAQEFREYLGELKREKYKGDDRKTAEIDQVLSEEFGELLKLAKGMHDLGKILKEVQEVINLRRKPTKEETVWMQRHTASEDMFKEVGITRDNYPTVLLVALYHHFPEYAGADPRVEPAFHVNDPTMELCKQELLKYTPIFISIAKIIDIIEAMTSQIRSYREPCIIRWFEKDTGEEYKRGDHLLHTSIEGELTKKCPENPELALNVLHLVHGRWEDKEGQTGLGNRLVRTREQLRAFGHEEAFDEMILEHNKPAEKVDPAQYSSGRMPKIS